MGEIKEITKILCENCNGSGAIKNSIIGGWDTCKMCGGIAFNYINNKKEVNNNGYNFNRH